MNDAKLAEICLLGKLCYFCGRRAIDTRVCHKGKGSDYKWVLWANIKTCSWWRSESDRRHWDEK